MTDGSRFIRPSKCTNPIYWYTTCLFFNYLFSKLNVFTSILSKTGIWT